MTIAEHWRKHHSLALAVGKKEVAKMEQHYAAHGLNVQHRRTAQGDYEPVITRPEHFERLLAARGMVNHWGA